MKKIFLVLIIGILLFVPTNNNQKELTETFAVSETGIITLNQTKISLGINYNYTIKAIISSNLSTSNIKWSSSNTNVATVDQNGRVTGLNYGTAYITASIGNNKAMCTVNIIDNYIAVTKINLNKSNITLTINNQEKITATLTPENATNKIISYSSSNPTVASIDSSGTITAKSIGITYITVTSGDSKTTCIVTVVDKIALSSISTKQSVTIKEKESTNLTITYNPANATNKKVTWKSSNEKIATVDQNGKVSAISAGSATITAISEDSHHVATCKVTVEAISKNIKNISLNKKELTLVVDQEETLTVKYDPDYAENKNVTWSSSDETIATVENGKIKALKVGIAEIKVISEDGQKEAICNLAVISPQIEKIEFEKEKYSVYAKDKVTLKVKLTPPASVLEDAIWESSDETIATVKNGVVTAKKIGTVTITVKTKDEKQTASTEVTIKEKPAEPLMITVDGYDLNFKPEQKDYKLQIKDEKSLNIKTNVDSKKVTIKGNQDLKNGSIITVTIKDKETTTYVINIAKKGNYTIIFIGVISLILLINIIRITVKSKKK